MVVLINCGNFTAAHLGSQFRAVLDDERVCRDVVRLITEGGVQ